MTTLQSRLDALEAATPGPVKEKPAVMEAIFQKPEPPARSGRLPNASGRGPLQFHGDFFLYFDSITRAAGGGAPAVSNIRGRYLMHLDFEAALYKTLSFHGRLSTAPLNNPLTDIQDFGGGLSKHPFSLSQAYVDYHPNEFLRLQGGRVDSPFNDKSRFLFDTDARFNGTSEFLRLPLNHAPAGLTELRLLGGQYTFTNPNISEVTPGVPSTAATATPSQALLAAGAEAGSKARNSQLFQQGFALTERLGSSLTSDFGADLQLYRNPNQLRLMSTPGGLFLIGTTVGTTPSSPVPSPGNATTTANGAMLTAPGFHIGHLAYTLTDRNANLFGRALPVSLNLQFSRNFEPVRSRDAWAAIASAGRSQEAGDIRAVYGFYHKGANSLIGELTDNDLAIGSDVNMRAHLFQLDYTLAHGVIFRNNLIWTRWLESSDPQAMFFVPLGRATPRQLRYQGILMLHF